MWGCHTSTSRWIRAEFVVQFKPTMFNTNRGDEETKGTGSAPLEPGAAAPLFTLSDAEAGQPHYLAKALERGPVLIGIYKSSCEASKTAFPFLQKITQAYPQLTVWGIAQDSPNVTRSFVRRTGVTFPMLIDDNDYAVSRAYNITATPTLYLIDRSGTIVWQRMGFQKKSMSELNARIAELLGVVPVDILVDSDTVPVWVPG